jgi:BRCA1 C Terminus (BRCT) domain
MTALFKGLKVSIDFNKFSEKQKFQKLIKEHGGEVSLILNKKVNTTQHHLKSHAHNHNHTHTYITHFTPHHTTPHHTTPHHTTPHHITQSHSKLKCRVMCWSLHHQKIKQCLVTRSYLLLNLVCLLFLLTVSLFLSSQSSLSPPHSSLSSPPHSSKL